MKTISSYLIVLFITLSVFTACKKMDSKYNQYVVPGGLIYPQQISNPYAQPGHNRIKISWLRGVDPTVVKAKIFWNNYADSVEINIPAIADTISTMIENLPEKSYSFEIKTYDNLGNSSVPVEIIRSVYGNLYQSLLLSRNVRSNIIDANGIVTIIWGDADITLGAYSSDFTYTNIAGVLKTVRAKMKQPSSVISDYKVGTTYKYRTLYLPDTTSIDTFYTDYLVQHISAKISKANWIATADSYTATGLLPTGGPPRLAIDDNITTYWHVVWPTPVTQYPHWLAIDMLQAVNVGNVELTSRQNSFTSFTDFIIQGSMDGINWTSYNSFKFLGINTPQMYSVPGSPLMRYVRIYMTKGTGTNTFANLGEFTAYGY